MKIIFGSFKRIKLRTLLITIPVTLAYPIIKALISEYNRLMIFADSLFIISLVLLGLGILFTFTRFGDFDITRYVFQRAFDKNVKSYEQYKLDREDYRKETFNYPLFFGLIYISISLFISLVIL